MADGTSWAGQVHGSEPLTEGHKRLSSPSLSAGISIQGSGFMKLRDWFLKLPDDPAA